MKRTVAIAALIVVSPAGCGPAPAVELDRMIVQHKEMAYEGSRFFADGRAMREPPEGTVTTDALVDDPGKSSGQLDGAYVNRIPVPLTRALFARGRKRFDIYCAACHGIAGDGQSEVARVMDLRRPPSLRETRIRALAPGRVYQVIAEGYGLMPPYRDALTVDERWAVVAYVNALVLSQAIALDDLPPEPRHRAEEALR